PATWHWSAAAQTTGAPVQAPAWQVSPVVQALPSLQAVPSGRAWPTQRSLASSQLPVWQASLCAEQSRVVPPVQAPAWQVFPTVQKLPSLQVPPSTSSWQLA